MNATDELCRSVLNCLFRATWQAPVLVGLVLLAHYVFKRQLTPRWRYSLWLLVVLRLALPLTVESRCSMFNIFQPPWTIKSVSPSAQLTPSSTYERPSLASQGELALGESVRAPGKPGQSSETNWRRHWPAIMALTWVVGALLFLGYVLFSTVRMARRIASLRPVENSAALELLEGCKKAFGLQVPIRLVQTKLVSSPALFGVLRPTLLLPAGLLENFTLRELRFVFLHELAHLKRRDLGMNWLLTILQSLHWFNPVVWLAFKRLREDRELACDALALAYAREGEHQSYGQAMIKLLEGFTRARVVPGLVGILENKNQMKRRIEMIAGFHKPVRWSALAALLVIALGITTLTEARTRPAERAAVAAHISSRATPATANAGSVAGGLQYGGRPLKDWLE